VGNISGEFGRDWCAFDKVSDPWPKNWASLDRDLQLPFKDFLATISAIQGSIEVASSRASRPSNQTSHRGLLNTVVAEKKAGEDDAHGLHAPVLG